MPKRCPGYLFDLQYLRIEGRKISNENLHIHARIDLDHASDLSTNRSKMRAFFINGTSISLNLKMAC